MKAYGMPRAGCTCPDCGLDKAQAWCPSRSRKAGRDNGGRPAARGAAKRRQLRRALKRRGRAEGRTVARSGWEV